MVADKSKGVLKKHDRVRLGPGEPTCSSDALWISGSTYQGLTCDGHGGAGAVHGHSSSRKFPPADAYQSATRPYAEDRADGEVGVDDRRPIQRVERHGVSL